MGAVKIIDMMKKILTIILALAPVLAFSQIKYDSVRVVKPQNFVEALTIDTAIVQIISQKAGVNRRVNFQTAADWILAQQPNLDSAQYANDTLLLFYGPDTILAVIPSGTIDTAYLSGDTLGIVFAGDTTEVVLAGLGDGNGIFDAANDGDTTAVASVVLGQDFTVDMDGNDWLFDGLVEDDTTSRIMTLRGDGSLAFRWLDSILNNYTTGSGTPGTLPIWTGANALGNSSLTESGGNVIGTSFTGAFGLATGTTAQVPVGANGRMRYNTTENGISAWNGAAAAWQYLPWADADNWASGRIPYSNGTNLTSSANLFYDGTDIGVTSGNFRVVSTGFGLEHPNSAALGLYYSTSNPKIYFNLHTGGNETYMEWRSSGGTARAKLGEGAINSYTNEGGSSSIAFATNRISSLSYNSNLSITGAGASSGQTGSSVTIEGGRGTNSYNGNHVYIRGGGLSVGALQAATGETGDVIISLYPDINTDTGQYPAVEMQRFRASGNVTNRTNWEVYRLNATTSGIRTLTMESDTVKYRIENLGTISTSTNGSGDIVVAHGMGTTPTSVQVTVTGTTPYVVTVHTIGATNFTVRFFDMTGAAVTSTAVTATWHAKT